MRVRYKHRLGGCPLLTLRRKRPAFPLLPGEAFHCDARKARFRVDEDDVEAAADAAIPDDGEQALRGGLAGRWR